MSFFVNFLFLVIFWIDCYMYSCYCFSSLCVLLCLFCMFLLWQLERLNCFIEWRLEKTKSGCNSGWVQAEHGHAQAVILSILFFKRIPGWARSMSFLHDRASQEARFMGSLYDRDSLFGVLQYYPKIIMAREHGDSMTVLPHFKYSILCMHSARPCFVRAPARPFAFSSFT